MRRFVLALLTSLTLFAQTTLPVPTARVTDTTGSLSQPQIEAISTKLKALEDKNGAQIIVYVAPTLNGVPIEDFGIQVARAWKPGQKKDNSGAILIVFKNDRKMRIEVGRGLEGVLTDTATKRILDDTMRPKFKAGDYAGGIADGVDQMIGLAGAEKFTPPVAGTATTVTPTTPFSFGSLWGWSIGLVLGSAGVLGYLLYANRKREEEEEAREVERERRLDMAKRWGREAKDREAKMSSLDRELVHTDTSSFGTALTVGTVAAVAGVHMARSIPREVILPPTPEPPKKKKESSSSYGSSSYGSSSSGSSSSSSSSSYDSGSSSSSSDWSSGGGSFDGGGSSSDW